MAASPRWFRSRVAAVCTVGAVIAVAVSACGSGPVAAPRSSADQVRMLVGVLVEPDEGQGGATVRWPGPAVTFRVDLPGYPHWFTAEVRAAFAWVAEHTSLQVAEVTGGGADIDVVAGGASIGDGAHTTARVATGGVIVHVTVRLGCCRRRPVWEDVAQAFGPLGDRADNDSVFSQTRTRELPSCFDAAVLATLYALAPGTGPGEVTRTAPGVLATTCGHR